MWRHFETFHVIQQPSYASKYPPLQGLLLAFGIVLGGSPQVGVWIGAGLAAAALCWMLQGWLPGKWALFGGLLYALHPTMQFACGAQSWGHSYWGGHAPLVGGALLFGALPRVVRRLRPLDAVLMVAGVAILANTRPFVGLVVSLAAGLTLAIWIVGQLRTNLANLPRLAARFVSACAGHGPRRGWLHVDL